MADRPERVPAEEVRQRMLDAGRAIALEAGTGLTIDHLRLEEVIARAEVPRSSVYRLWPYKDDYIDDLLIYLAGPGSFFTSSEVFDPETFAIPRAVIAGNWRLAGTLEGRRAILCETVRLAAARNYRALSDSPYWRIHNALIATVGSTRQGDARDKIAVALEHAQFQSRVSMLGLFGYLSAALGLRPRDPARSIAHLALAGRHPHPVPGDPARPRAGRPAAHQRGLRHRPPPERPPARPRNQRGARGLDAGVLRLPGHHGRLHRARPGVHRARLPAVTAATAVKRLLNGPWLVAELARALWRPVDGGP